MDVMFSIVIPTYNRKKLLKNVLYSLNCQTVKNFEVIIIDDGSNDGTRDMIDNLMITYPMQYCFIEKVKGTGAARARNKGIDIAKGDIIIFMDSDSLVPPVFVEEHQRFHELHNNIAVVSLRWQLDDQVIDADMIVQGIKKEYLPIKCIENQNKVFGFFSQNFGQYIMPWWFFSTSNASVRKKALIEVGKFDELFGKYILYEDTELAYRLYQNGVQFALNRKAECFHLYHSVDEVNKLELSKGNITYFQSKYKDAPEIQYLDIIKQSNWNLKKNEERVWRLYWIQVMKAKKIKTKVTKCNYILVVHNDWKRIRCFLKNINKKKDADFFRVIVLDLNSLDNTDFFIQLLSVKFPLQYFPVEGITKEEAIKDGLKKILYGQTVVLDFTNDKERAWQ